MPTVTFDSFANVIDGKLVSTPETRHGINPATKENLFPVPVSTRGTVDTAVAAAKRASAAWSAIPWSERQQCLIRLADAIEAQTEDFAKMLTLEQGKPVCYFLPFTPSLLLKDWLQAVGCQRRGRTMCEASQRRRRNAPG